MDGCGPSSSRSRLHALRGLGPELRDSRDPAYDPENAKLHQRLDQVPIDLAAIGPEDVTGLGGALAGNERPPVMQARSTRAVRETRPRSRTTPARPRCGIFGTAFPRRRPGHRPHRARGRAGSGRLRHLGHGPPGRLALERPRRLHPPAPGHLPRSGRTSPAPGHHLGERARPGGGAHNRPEDRGLASGHPPGRPLSSPGKGVTHLRRGHLPGETSPLDQHQ